MGEGAGAEGEQGLGYWAAKLIALKQKKKKKASSKERVLCALL